MTDPRRLVPRTDVVLADPRLVRAVDELGVGRVRDAVRTAQERVRRGELDPDRTADEAVVLLPSATGLRPVINATGVMLHTNLGRAPLSAAAVRAMADAAGYTDVEFDLATGTRARRGRSAQAALLDAVPEAQDALIVNNGAAALALAAAALAGGRELIVARGQLVEIGDGFRLPDLLEASGTRLREVGTTNRVTLTDYQAAIGDATGAVLSVHPSNFRIMGFTAQVDVSTLRMLGVPVIADIGSGLLKSDPLLPDEPDAQHVLAAGADVVTASGDKLLGGPQAGLVLGRHGPLERLRRHPLARAFRVDKVTLAALEATLRGPAAPAHRYLHADADVIRRRCELVAEELDAQVDTSTSVVGGGGAPGLELPSWAVVLPVELANPLRTGEPPIVGRVERGRLLLDLRSVEPAHDVAIVAAVRATRT